MANFCRVPRNTAKESNPDSQGTGVNWKSIRAYNRSRTRGLRRQPESGQEEAGEGRGDEGLEEVERPDLKEGGSIQSIGQTHV